MLGETSCFCCTGRLQETRPVLSKLRNLVVWNKFKAVGPWELCASLSALGPRMLSQSSLSYLLWKHMKTKISHMEKVYQATKHFVGPGEGGGKYADFQQLNNFVG